MECEKIEMAQKTKNILNSNKHIRNSSVNQILPLNSDVQTVADDLDSAKQHLDKDSSSQNQQSYMNIQDVTAEN